MDFFRFDVIAVLLLLLILIRSLFNSFTNEFKLTIRWIVTITAGILVLYTAAESFYKPITDILMKIPAIEDLGDNASVVSVYIVTILMMIVINFVLKIFTRESRGSAYTPNFSKRVACVFLGLVRFMIVAYIFYTGLSLLNSDYAKNDVILKMINQLKINELKSVFIDIANKIYK